MPILPVYPPCQIEPEQRRHFAQDQQRASLAGMRWMMPVASALFLLAGVGDIGRPDGAAAIQLRLLLFLALLLPAIGLLLARRPPVRSCLALLFLALLSGAIALMAARAAAPLSQAVPPVALLLALNGLLWRRPVALLVATLAVLLPALGLFRVDAGAPADLLGHGFHLALGAIAGLALHWFGLRQAVEHFLLREGLIRGARHDDALTGVLNRAGWEDKAPGLMRRMELAGRPLSLAVFDLDQLARYNATHGEDAGDRMLGEVAELIRGELREGDLVARLGGEEFAVLLPDVAARGARAVANRIRAALLDCRLRAITTLSAGVATRRPGESLDALTDRAEAALGEAKQAGCNCVRVA